MEVKKTIIVVAAILSLIAAIVIANENLDGDVNAGNVGVEVPFGNSTLYVGGSGPGNYSSIQDAIDNASDGDTVFVYDDSSPYYEHVKVNKSINLIGEDRDTTIIDGNGSGDVVYISADWVNIDGFTVRHGGSESKYPAADAGIEIYNSLFNKITNCNVSDNDYMGIFINKSSNNIITDCISLRNDYSLFLFNSSNITIINCVASLSHGADAPGIGIFTSSNTTVINCTTYNNTEFGIAIWNSANNCITNCKVYNNLAGIVLVPTQFPETPIDQYNTVSHNEIWNNEIGIASFYSNNDSFIDNDIHDCNDGIWLNHSSFNDIIRCRVYKDTNYGIRLWNCSNNSITNTNCSNNDCGIDLFLSSNNNISGNNIISNKRGIIISSSYFNVIKYNNFIKNSKHAGFYYESLQHSFSNSWNINYWDRPRILPKPVFGQLFLFPWLNFD